MARAGHDRVTVGADAVFIPHSRPFLGADEAAAVAAVVESGQLAQGPRVAELEASTARVVDLVPTGGDAGAHGVAVSSGTAALYVALRALGVGSGDQVLIPAFACASLEQAVRHADATPRYVDCDPASLNPDPTDARRKLGARTAACIVPHMFGLPADVEAFVDLGVPVIEDCAQTLGVSLGGRRVGSIGAVAVCSFYATKLVAGGEGGMMLSGDRQLAARARALRDCEQPEGAEDAFNFKMSDLHAAVARVQLGRLEELLARRRLLASDYCGALHGADIDLPIEQEDRGHAWFRFVVRLRSGALEPILDACEQRGLACRRPVGKLARDLDLEALPGCRSAWARACSLPLYPALTEEEARRVPARFAAALAHTDD